MTNFFNFLNRSLHNTTLIVVVFILILVANAFGQIGRWDLLDQISMADSYAKFGKLYPSASSLDPTGVSVYFPGVALIAIMLSKLGIDFYLIEVMLLIACVIVVLFLSIQKVMASEISGIKYSWSEFTPFAISASLVISPFWLFYAREFKPDTIAFLLGFLGIVVSDFLKPNCNIYKVILGSFVCGCALFFKQQSIPFIFGLLFFCVFNPSRVRIIFFLSLSTFATGVILFYYQNPNIWFWNIMVLSDDGFVSFKSAIRDNYSTIVTLVFFILFGSTFFKLIQSNQKNDGKILFNLHDMRVSIRSSAWFWVAIPSALGSFAGALKTGGNGGNSQLGLILLLPFAFVLFNKIERSIIVSIAWIGILLSLPSLYSGPQKYLEAIQLRNFAVKDLQNKPDLILTGSDVYFASRVYRANSKVVNFWTISLRDQSDPTTALYNTLLKIQPDRLVVENWPANKAVIMADSRYEVVFENNQGLIASLRSMNKQ
jgi:hypothetical protein